MNTIRNTLAIALTAVTLGVGAISTSTTASAFEPRFVGIHRYWGNRIGVHINNRIGIHINNRIGIHINNRFGFHGLYRFGPHPIFGHCWNYHCGYRWAGYRRVIHVGVIAPSIVVAPPVVIAPPVHVVAPAPVEVVAPRVEGVAPSLVCPTGMHLGHQSKFCWPNR